MGIVLHTHRPYSGLVYKTILFSYGRYTRGKNSNKLNIRNARVSKLAALKTRIRYLCGDIKNEVSMLELNERQIGRRNVIYGYINEIYDLCK